MEMQARGYLQTEIARELDITKQQLNRILERIKRRVSTDDVKQWRQVQLLRMERLLEACRSVLDANHVVVSNGHIVQADVLDDEGKPVWDPVYGPDGEPLTNDAGEIRVEKRKVALLDHAAVLDAVAEMRKVEAEIAKLLGTQAPVRQAVEVQHVNYEVTGVDLSKTLGLNTGTE